MLAPNQSIPVLGQYFLHAGTFNYLLLVDTNLPKTDNAYYVTLWQWRPGSIEPRLITSPQAIRSLLLSCKRYGAHLCNPSGPCVKEMRANEDTYQPTPQEEDRNKAAGYPFDSPSVGVQEERVARNLSHAQFCQDCNTFWDIRTGECACGQPYQNQEDNDAGAA